MMEKLTAHNAPRSRRVLLAALASAFALLFAFSAMASAEVKYEFGFGTEGTGAGQFREPASISQNTTTGDIYVADRQNNRIQKFDEDGNFLEAWGFDVVASGADNKPVVDEVQRVNIKAVDGTFSLTFGADTTPQLAYNAGSGAVETALNALPSINTGGGSVTVAGGPGDATGSNPYVVTFGGTLAGADRPELSIDRTRLARPVGSQLSCKGTARYVIAEGSFDFRWLRNGVPIEGATGQTYTTTAADSGKAVQCEVEATYENDEPFQHGWATNNDYALIGSTPAPPPPLPPAEIASPSGPALIGAPSGNLTCDAGTWQNGPTTYRYQWFGHFAELADVTTASSTNELALSEGGPRRRRDIPVQGHGHQRRGQCRDVEPSQTHRSLRSPHRRQLQLRIPGGRSLCGGWDEQRLDQGQRRRPVRGLQADRHLQSGPRRTEHGAILETAGRRCRQLARRRRRRLGRGRSQLPDSEAHSGWGSDPDNRQGREPGD